MSATVADIGHLRFGYLSVLARFISLHDATATRDLDTDVDVDVDVDGGAVMVCGAGAVDRLLPARPDWRYLSRDQGHAWLDDTHHPVRPCRGL
ncbi:hypothetical protein [Corynebacterium pacaense]|uniref:hypothetical protein n=1 Tax=Corynebacterium pacaense TaxID=1816684 RepID=UPI0009BB6B83|nr:hypothetical protein [Corynebacterium pacaense]